MSKSVLKKAQNLYLHRSGTSTLHSCHYSTVGKKCGTWKGKKSSSLCNAQSWEWMPFSAAQYFNVTRQCTKFQDIHGLFQMPVHNCEQSSLLQDTETLLPNKWIFFSPPFCFFLFFFKLTSLWNLERKQKQNRKKGIPICSLLQM